MAYPELQGIEIELNPVTSDTLVTYWQYWVSLDGQQRSPKLRGIEIESGETFANEFPLTGVTAGGGAQIIGSPIIQTVGRVNV